MGQPVSLTKALVASSSLALGLFSSAATTLYTSGSSAQIGTSSGAIATLLDTDRRIIIWSTGGDLTGLTVKITGTNSGGDIVIETVVGSSASGVVRTTVQDFNSVTSIVFSSLNPIAAALHVATSSRGGTPWITTNTWADPFDLTALLTLSATNNSMSANFECTLDDVVQTTPQAVRAISSTPTTIVPWFPLPFISQTPGSTFISTAIDAVTMGNITTPIAAWRVTLTSSSSTAGTCGVTVLQSG
jgi:hypothetical protein